jgi:hypothetical protein
VNDIEAAERVLAQLSDQKDRATEQVSKIAARRQVLAYAVLARNDKKAQDELTTLNQQLADLAVTIENIDSADAEARCRLDAAKAASARTSAQKRCQHVNELLVGLQECAPPLDVSWGTVVTGTVPGGFRIDVGPKNGPLYIKAATLVGEIFAELKALGLDRDVAWHRTARWDVGTAEDLRRALETAVKAYCGRLPRSWNFVGLTDALSNSVRAALKQREQTDNAGRVAA